MIETSTNTFAQEQLNINKIFFEIKCVPSNDNEPLIKSLILEWKR